MQLFFCPCCGYQTLDEKPPGTFNICEVCFWEDDNVQFDDLDYVGGANRVSLRIGRLNFERFGACQPDMAKHVRKPRINEPRQPEWKAELP